MLHILFLILKILGIIIAAILGILVLVLCIVLFVPVRYEIAVRCDGQVESLKVKAKVTWFLHLVRGDVLYSDQSLKRRIRIAWKWLGKKQTRERTKEKTKKTVSDSRQSKKVEEPVPKTQTQVPPVSQQLKGPEKKTPTSTVKKESTKKESTKKEPTKKTLPERIHQRWEQLKQRFKSWNEKWKELQGKKEKLETFLKDEIHKKAFGKLKKELLILLKKWKPKKLKLRVRFGFEDPCTTGQVLAVLAVIYPFLGDDLYVEPEFEKPVFKGTIDLKGKIRLSYLAGCAIRTVLSKAVRVTYQDVREFEL